MQMRWDPECPRLSYLISSSRQLTLIIVILRYRLLMRIILGISRKILTIQS